MSPGRAGAAGRAARVRAAVRAAGLWVPLLLALPARAQGVAPEPGAEALPPRPATQLSLGGYLRVRGDLLYNADLDHGPTPSGATLFPLPADRPESQWLESANLRLRLEPVWQPSPSVRVRAQIDVLDNVVLGSNPEGLPRDRWTPMASATLGQASPSAGQNAWSDAIRVKRVWAEVLLPFGVLAVGRQGALVNWGTGFFINAGNDLDADRSDAADRITFATSLGGHLWMLAFEWSATGPTSENVFPADQPFSVARQDDVRTVAFAMARYHSPAGVRRRLRAGRASINYGLVAAYRSQAVDFPGFYAPGGLAGTYGPDQAVSRDARTVSGDLWLRLLYKGFRLELEAAVVWGRVGDASLDPGVSITVPIESLQWGAVLESAWRIGRSGWSLGLHAGAASGDPAPGFGVRPPLGQTQSLPGDLDGPQFRLPGDRRVDNFRFHPNYHVDLILFRQILGTVTDAAYLRPWVRWQSAWGLGLEAVAITSFALEPASAPGGKRPLGLELDLTARFAFDASFEVRLTLGTLFPLAGLDNVRLGYEARPAFALHALMGFRL